jgi:hypothetical protein
MKSVIMTFRVSPEESGLVRLVARYLDRRASHWIRELIICGAIGVVELHDAGALEKSSERRRLMVKIRKALADLAPDRGPTG